MKNVDIKLDKGSLNNIFQDSFNKILSQQLTHDRSYISPMFIGEVSALITRRFCLDPHYRHLSPGTCFPKGFVSNFKILDFPNAKSFTDDKQGQGPQRCDFP